MTRLTVGFTQQIQLEWLEWAAQFALAGLSVEEIREELQRRLRPLVSVGGDDLHSNRGKVVGILLKTWVNVPAHLHDFRDDALEMFAAVPLDQHLALHWGMVMAVYPFFGTVVDALGRLLELQELVTFSQVNRRVQEAYGQRESIRRATQRILYTLQAWEVLGKTEERSVYAGKRPLNITEAELATWLIEAAMITKDAQAAPWNASWKQPVLFPFSLTMTSVDHSERLELVRQGLDNDVIVRMRGVG